MHFQFWQPLWPVQRLYSSTSVPPLPPQSAHLPHLHPLLGHKDDSEDFLNEQAVKFVSGTCWSALGSWCRETHNNLLDLSDLPPVTCSTTWSNRSLGRFWNHRRWVGVGVGIGEMPRTTTSAPPAVFSKAPHFLKLRSGLGNTDLYHLLPNLLWLFSMALICKSVKAQDLKISMPAMHSVS